jgi:hypothetical protein
MTAHTPLECLLLFRALATYGTDDNSFVRISELLTNNTFVKDGDTYDAGRLTADSLRELYLQLLRDELDAEEESQEDETALPFITIPIMVDRLYERFRSWMIDAIKEDERRYADLQQEIEEIERGEWDERILADMPAATYDIPICLKISHNTDFSLL